MLNIYGLSSGGDHVTGIGRVGCLLLRANGHHGAGGEMYVRPLSPEAWPTAQHTYAGEGGTSRGPQATQTSAECVW